MWRPKSDYMPERDNYADSLAKVTKQRDELLKVCKRALVIAENDGYFILENELITVINSIEGKE